MNNKEMFKMKNKSEQKERRKEIKRRKVVGVPSV